MVILVRYGEIALKSEYVRRSFLDRLVDNIQDHLLHEGLECGVERERGRIFLYPQDEDSCVQLLRRVFGIVSFSPAVETSSKMGEICDTAADVARRVLKEGMSFAVKSRRTGTHPYTSHDVAVEVGDAVRNAVPGLKVDLKNPDKEIYVEVRGKRGYIFTEKIPGPGGLPIGTQGRVVALVEDKRGAVAAWLMMKRGCRCVVAFQSPSNWSEALRRWDVNLREERIGNLVELEPLARKLKAEGLTLGWSAEELVEKPRIGEMPLFLPLVGLADQEIDEYWKMISES